MVKLYFNSSRQSDSLKPVFLFIQNLTCKEYKLDYITELDLVVKWLDEFYSSEIFLKEDFKKIYFLADSSYDVKKN